MSLYLAFATKTTVWRRAGSSLALIGALSFALQPTLLLAQSVDPDGAAKVQTKAKNPNASNAAKKTAKGKKSPTDNLSDDLNRRESERVEQVLRGMPATNFGAPTVGASVDAPPEPETAIGMASAIKAPVLSERPQPAPAAVKTEPFGRSAALQAASLVKSEPDDKLDDNSSSKLSRSKVDQARRAVQAMVMTRIDLAAAVSMPRSELVRQLEGLAAELLSCCARTRRAIASSIRLTRISSTPTTKPWARVIRDRSAG